MLSKSMWSYDTTHELIRPQALLLCLHWRGAIINHGKVLMLVVWTPVIVTWFTWPADVLLHHAGLQLHRGTHQSIDQSIVYSIAPEHRSTMYRCTGYYHSTRALCTVFWVTSHHHSTVYRDAGYHQSTRVLCTGVLCTGYCHNNRVLCTIILFTIRIGVSSTYVTFVYSYYHQRQCT